ncbi:MAG: alpha/beta fold hydrolase [Thermoanaerobaculia bacterium]|nr:alpha/beta fold hydrolase [Thermoanaerobaculia bacterium]
MQKKRSRGHAFGAIPTLPVLSIGIVIALAFTNALVAQSLTFTRLAGPETYGWYDGPASEARFRSLGGITPDPNGNLYITDGNVIRKIAPDGSVTTVAGLAGQQGSADGPGSTARFNTPRGLIVDSGGNVFVADTFNHTIRKITPAGVVSTVAGLAGTTGSTDGPADVARFNAPDDVALDHLGNLYIADCRNKTIRKMTPDRQVTTLAGKAGEVGSADGKGSAARFSWPCGVGTDMAGNVYVADWRDHIIRKITPDGMVSTLAGLAGSQGAVDGVGSAARFGNPNRVVVDPSGDAYVAESGNNTVRRISPSGVVSTVAGLAGIAGFREGSGGQALFDGLQALTRDVAGNIYVTDANNISIRAIDPHGIVSTFSGAARTFGEGGRPSGSADGVGSAARFYRPQGLAVEPSGELLVADTDNNTIREITQGGDVKTVAGSAGVVGNTDGTGTVARFYRPVRLVPDMPGTFYISDSGNKLIRMMTPKGDVTTFSLTPPLESPPGSAVLDSSGNLLVLVPWDSVILKLSTAGAVTTFAGQKGKTGSTDGPAASARFDGPQGLTIDGSGNVYVADAGNYTIRKITPDGTVSTLSGRAGVRGDVDGDNSVARFWSPQNVLAHSNGDVLVADGNVLKRIAPDGMVTSIAGSRSASGTADGTGSEAQFQSISGMAVDATGNIYLSDRTGNTIWKGSTALPDIATIDSPTGETGHPRQLGTTPETATSWRWQVVRREAGSTAPLSSATVRNPTFTADRPGLYTFRLTATDGVKTSITLVSLTVTGEPIVCRATRTLPVEYLPGQPVPVTIQTAPAPDATSYSVEETPPAGWAVSNVTGGGSYNSSQGVITWGPFTHSQPLTLSYETTPPAGASGTKTFSGRILAGSETTATCGATNIHSSSHFVVDFSFTPSSPHARETVRFQPLFAGTAASWSWDFGTGGAASDKEFPSFVFPAAGTYNVTLTLTDKAGQSGSRTKTVTLGAPFTAEPPVLLVNGFCADESSWEPLLENLATLDPVRFTADPAHLAFDGTSVLTLPGPAIAGSRIFTMTFRNNAFTGGAALEKTNVNDAPIEDLAYQLKNVLAAIRTATGSPVVDIVGHSMGGLVARAYVSGLACPAGTTNNAAYGNDVRRIITISTPHAGTDPGLWSSMNCACATEASTQKDQMTASPENAFLRLLNATPVPQGAFLESLVSRCTHQTSDGIVCCDSQDVTKVYTCPAESVHSTQLIFADSEIPSLLHTDVLASARTASEVFRVLSSISQERTCLHLVPGTATALPGAMTVFAASVVSVVLTFTGTPAGGCTVDVIARSASGAELVKRTVPAEGSQRADLGVLAPGTVIQLVSTCDVSVSAAVSTDPAELLMTKGRVSVSVIYRNQYTGQTGTAIPLPQKDGFGFFTFSDPNNPEVFVKVLDFGATSPYLLFYAGLTDFEYTVTFQNLSTGKSISFKKPAGSFIGGANNTDLPQSTARAVLWSQDGDGSTPIPAAGFRRIAPAVPRVESELVLSKGRVTASVTWKSQYTGQTGTATPIPRKDEFGFFAFSSPDNPEVFVKVLDFGASSPYLLFFAGLTDLEYTVTFRSVSTGQSVSFRKDPGTFNGGADNTSLKH